MTSIKKTILIFFTLLLFLFFAGCIGQLEKIKLDWASKTTKDKAAIVNAIYIGAAQDYERDVNRANLSDDQVQYLRDKYKALTRIYPAVKAYDDYARTGQIPTLAMEQAIIDAIDELILYPALE